MESREVLLAGIESRLHDGDAVAALSLVERYAPHYPGDDRFYRLRVATLSEIGASHRAWALYRARPELFSAEQSARFEADRLARLVLWTEQYPQDETRLLADAERAEAAIAEYARSLPEGVALPDRIRHDRLIALNRLQRHDEVAAEYDAMRASGLQVPGYALAAVGDSLLALQRPEEAAQALDGALAADPDDIDVQTQRAYAALELEHHQDARARLLTALEAEAPWPREPGAASGWQNWRRYQAETTYAMILAFGGDLPQAQEILETLVKTGPGHAGLQSSLGTVYLLRGWPERALERFNMASTLDARDIYPQVGRVDALTALQRDDLARPLRDELVRDHADQPAVQRMDRAWRIHRGWQWSVRAGGGRNQNAATALSPLGGRDRHYGFQVQGPVLGDRWRLVASHDLRWSDFQGERVEDRRTAAGIRYAHDRLDWGLQASRPSDGIGGTGLDADAGWRFNDAWSLRTTLRRNDAEGSMQARGAGITADSVDLSASYAPSERTRWYAGAKHWRYDDGNRRDALSLGLDQRLLTTPHFLLDGLAGVYASRGSHDDAPYFNPSRDASVELGLRADHLAWRRYERHFRHRLTVRAGNYRQQGYGNAWIPSLGYEHEWQFALGRVLTYGLHWSRPVYDGQREERLGFEAGFRWGN